MFQSSQRRLDEGARDGFCLSDGICLTSQFEMERVLMSCSTANSLALCRNDFEQLDSGNGVDGQKRRKSNVEMFISHLQQDAFDSLHYDSVYLACCSSFPTYTDTGNFPWGFPERGTRLGSLMQCQHLGIKAMKPCHHLVDLHTRLICVRNGCTVTEKPLPNDAVMACGTGRLPTLSLPLSERSQPSSEQGGLG